MLTLFLRFGDVPLDFVDELTGGFYLFFHFVLFHLNGTVVVTIFA